MRDAARIGLAVAVILALALPSPGVAGQQPASPSAEAAALATGLRQVDEGDFEAAIATLDPVADRLIAERSLQAARACLGLGIAHLALDRRDLAKRRFRQALDAQPDLRLGTDRYSPKVISAFEEARRERDAARRAASGSAGGGGSKKGKAFLIGGAGVAAGVGIALLATRSSTTNGGGGTLRLTGARFAPTAITCPNGAEDLPLQVDLYVEAANDGSETVRITAVNSRLVITNSPGFPSEVGFSDSRLTTVTPSSVGTGQATLHLVTSLKCGNGTGDEARFSDWQGTVWITTPAGTVTADTPPNGLRVNIP